MNKFMQILLKTTPKICLVILFYFENVYSQNIHCRFCKNPIKEQYIIVDKLKYHKRCYKDHVQPKCNICKKVIEGIYNVDGEKRYHNKCYEDFMLPKCTVCTKTIKTTYIIDKWDNKYHNHHQKKLPKCESSDRLICKNITNGGYNISRNRNICNLCKPSAVISKKTVFKYARQVKKDLKNIGLPNLPKNIPITLIKDRTKLKKLSKIKHTNLSGYTHYEYETINGEITTEKYHIYILSHLHEIEFKSVLAHEFLHVFIFQNKYKLSPEYREGFCNLGSQLIYEKDNSKLAKHKLNSMHENPDPVYGMGFKKMNQVLKQNGWAELIRDLSKF